MKQRKNTSAKIVAFIALLAIVIGIIGTGALVIVNSFTGGNSNYGDNVELTEEQLQQYLEAFSGSTTTVEADGITIETGEEILNNQTEEDSSVEDVSEISESDTLTPNDQEAETSEEVELEASVEVENNIEAGTDSPDIIETLNPEL